MAFPPFLPNVPIEPDDELMPERGALAIDQPRGGILSALGRGADRLAGGINKVRAHPLYEMLWKGAVSGMAGDPRAGQQALKEMQAGPSLQDTLTQLRIRDYENRLADSQVKKDAEKTKQEKLSKLSEYIRLGDIENARALAAELEPQSAAGELFRATVQPKLVEKKNQDGTITQVWVDPSTQKELGTLGGPAPRWNPNSSGVSITGYDDQGRPFVQVGGSPVTTGTRTALEKKQIDAQDTISRLDAIKSSFRPEFQQYGTKLASSWNSIKASLGSDLDPKDRALLESMADHRSSSLEMMSHVLNQLSGAAISPAEFERLKGFLPNVGANIWDGDDPITFESKLKRFDRSVRLALVRYEYAKKKGLDTGGIPLTIEELEKRVGKDELVRAGILSGGQPKKPGEDGLPK